ncbi:MAG TPA: protein translocase subunit SecD [Clostridia bacterium]|nr:protein translocase subunit SecD [Clostridia bacterium]
MYKRVGKPVFFVVLLVILAISYLSAFGVRSNYGDVSTAIIKGAQDMRFGIDIRGGVDVTFRPPKNFNATSDQMKAAEAIINQRLDNLKISDREVYTDTAHDRIIVRFPWKSGEKSFDPESAIKELGATALLTFKAPDGTVVLSGSDVKNASPAYVQTTGQYVVNLTLSDTGKTKFAAATKKYLGQIITINMDNQTIESPSVKSEIDNGQAEIEGNFTSASATALANKINAGALPFKLETDNFSTISPTLGSNALNVMLLAGGVAFGLICLFMMLYYRLPGVVACIALCGHLAGTILAISIPQFTLTLPGIAGIILSIGMGVDCNVITAERIKEELRTGKTLDGAIDAGFDRSFSAIFDGNVTVIIVGIILMWLGSGSVKSFGYTLICGVVFNFVMGLMASRLMLKSVSRFSFARKDALYNGRAVK